MIGASTESDKHKIIVKEGQCFKTCVSDVRPSQEPAGEYAEGGESSAVIEFLGAFEGDVVVRKLAKNHRNATLGFHTIGHVASLSFTSAKHRKIMGKSWETRRKNNHNKYAHFW